MSIDGILELSKIVYSQLENFPAAQSTAAVQEFQNLFSPGRLEKGASLVQAGETAAKLGFICKGVMRAYHVSRDGQEYTKTIFQERDFVAPLAALTTRQPSPITLQALTPVELLLCDYQALEGLYRKHHCLEHFGRLTIQREWVKKEIREIQLVTLGASRRYELFLREHKGLEHRIPWYIIASYLGITPVALSRIRGRRKKQKPPAAAID